MVREKDGSGKHEEDRSCLTLRSIGDKIRLGGVKAAIARRDYGAFPEYGGFMALFASRESGAFFS